MQTKNSGIGLLELMLSLIIVAILALLAVRYFQVAEENTKVDKTVMQVRTLVKASYDWVEGQSDFAAVSTNALLQMNLISASDTTNPWGNSNQVTGANNNTQVQVSIANIPQTACQNLLRKLSDGSNLQCNPASPATTTTFSGVF